MCTHGCRCARTEATSLRLPRSCRTRSDHHGHRPRSSQGAPRTVARWWRSVGRRHRPRAGSRRRPSRGRSVPLEEFRSSEPISRRARSRPRRLTTPMTTYVDSSALLKNYFAEPDSVARRTPSAQRLRPGHQLGDVGRSATQSRPCAEWRRASRGQGAIRRGPRRHGPRRRRRGRVSRARPRSASSSAFDRSTRFIWPARSVWSFRRCRSSRSIFDRRRRRGRSDSPSWEADRPSTLRLTQGRAHPVGPVDRFGRHAVGLAARRVVRPGVTAASAAPISLQPPLDLGAQVRSQRRAGAAGADGHGHGAVAGDRRQGEGAVGRVVGGVHPDARGRWRRRRRSR